MRKLFTTIFAIASLSVFAQYSTPGTGLEIDLQYLVDNSGGVVTLDEGEYLFSDSVTIAGDDTLRIEEERILRLNENVLLTIEGGMYVTDSASFLPGGMGYYAGLRFESGSKGHIQNSYFIQGGGIRVLTGDFIIEGSEITFQEGIASTGGAIGLSTGRPQIIDCYIHDNVRAAISSGANSDAAPVIENCVIEFNVSDNSNRPQINLGPSGQDTTIVRNCEIIGNPANDMAGGIGISNLLGTGTIHAVVEGNQVQDNRYGVAFTGSNIFTRIVNNSFIDNDTQGEPFQGGSGINLNNSGENMHYVEGNVVTGNLWGVTMQGEAMANFGDTATANFNPGQNVFENNGNGGETYALYNNTSNEVTAMSNCWMGENDITPAEAEEVIFHLADDETLGEVIYEPLGVCGTSGQENVEFDEVAGVFPNPVGNNLNVTLKKEISSISLFDLSGKQVLTEPVNAGDSRTEIAMEELAPGMYILKLHGEHFTTQTRVIKQ